MFQEFDNSTNTYIYRSKQFFSTFSVYIMASKSVVEINHKFRKL